jgi:hypothetical protein
MVSGSTRNWIAVNCSSTIPPLNKKMKTKNMTTSQLRNSINRSPWRRGVFLLPLALACFGLLPPKAFGVSPAPDGGYVGWNTAEGQDALLSLVPGAGNGFNTAIGGRALYLDTTGQGNTAIGAFALSANTSGDQNVAIGQSALAHNTASGNVAVGFQALFNNTSSGNSYQALFNQRDGLYNNGFGWKALYNNVSGDNNTAIGHAAGLNITGNGNVDIGANVRGVAGENNITRIRNIGTTPYNTGRMVQVDSNGKLGYVVSSRRYKEEIKPMDKDSEALFALKPVSFRYKDDIDPAHAKMFGLIAEDVAEINPDLVVRNAEGEVDTIRFDSINAMLLNEFLKQHRKVQRMEVNVAQQRKDFEATIAQQENEIESITASLREHAAQIQKVSARLGVSQPGPQVVANQ